MENIQLVGPIPRLLLSLRGCRQPQSVPYKDLLYRKSSPRVNSVDCLDGPVVINQTALAFQVSVHD